MANKSVTVTQVDGGYVVSLDDGETNWVGVRATHEQMLVTLDAIFDPGDDEAEVSS